MMNQYSCNMKLLKLFMTMSLTLCGLVLKAYDSGNVAYQDSHVRFTVITDGVIRLEWQPEGKFTDAPSFVASVREYPDVMFTVKDSRRKVEIRTDRMVVSYKKGSGCLSEDNLEIKGADGFFTWHPGMKQKENLKGTFRTLDGLEGDIQAHTFVVDMKPGERREFEDGILARDGWTLIDESDNYLFDDSEWAWVKEREAKECQDWYFMAYGNDYKAALKDFTVFAGKMPLPPRFTFGYWWSRYWAYTDKELRDLVAKMKAYDIPLDVLVVDMDWHYTDPGRGAWTGWTWNRSIFPDPQKFMSRMKEEGLKITLNLHPAGGFEHYEWCYPALAESLGYDPADKKRIEWISSDKKFMENMFRHAMHPMQKEGVDFWWLDWQQHVYDPVLTKLHNTWWLNYCYFTDMERSGDRRPMLYHRWGGLGNHRYQIGFSGDATISWKSLDFQPYFTSTSSNVLYGYWSHDIGGHVGKKIDPEMYVRWLQFGGFSPVMRTHSSKNKALNKEPWVFEEQYTDIIRQTVRQRYQMAPYIYTMARKGYDEGLALCRPMYYDHPAAAEAYSFKNQYMFGDDMLIAPITVPSENGFAEMDVWLPEGDWFELHTGTLIKGGRILKRHFALDEYGVYIKAGSVLPYYGDDVDNLERNDEDIYVTVYPGGDGRFDMYEDAGNSKDYANEYAVTSLKNSWSENVQTVVIAPRTGTYKGMPEQRCFKVKVVSSVAPLSVTVNGQKCGYTYCGEDFSFIVDVPVSDCDVEKVVRMVYPEDRADVANGITGYSRRVARSIEAMKFRSVLDPYDALARMGSVNEAAEYNPSAVSELVASFMASFQNLDEITKAQPRIKPEDVELFLHDCGWNRR